MSNQRRRIITFCLGVGITFIVAGLFPYIYASAQDETSPTLEVTPELLSEIELTAEATVETTSEPVSIVDVTPEVTLEGEVYQIPVVSNVQPTGDNGYCAVCHNQPWRAVTLADGHVLNLYASPQVIQDSVHGENNPQGTLGCLDCHGEDTFPHNGPTPADARTYALTAVQMCAKCHTREAEDLQTGLHEQAILRGDLKAAVCTDCHGAHDIRPAANQPQLVAGVCGNCHTSTVEEWRSSPHVDIGPLGCATCHSQHSQRLRADTPDSLCVNCHKAPSNIYAHTQHINSRAEVQCIDCHMYREEGLQVSLISLQPTGHTMIMDTRPCNTCHEDLEVTGKWDELTRSVESQIMSERDELQAQVIELESQLSQVEADGTNDAGITYTQLVQGLIIGLGLGVTAAIILVPRFVRSNRRKENTDE